MPSFDAFGMEEAFDGLEVNSGLSLGSVSLFLVMVTGNPRSLHMVVLGYGYVWVLLGFYRGQRGWKPSKGRQKG